MRVTTGQLLNHQFEEHLRYCGLEYCGVCTYYCMIYAPGMYPGAEAHYDSSTLATCLWRAIFCDCLACGIFFGGGGIVRFCGSALPHFRARACH